MKTFTNIVRNGEPGEKFTHRESTDAALESINDMLLDQLTETLGDMGLDLKTVTISLGVSFEVFVKQAKPATSNALVTPNRHEITFWRQGESLLAVAPGGLVFIIDKRDGNVLVVSNVKPGDLVETYEGPIDQTTLDLIDNWLPKPAAAKAA